MAEQPLRDRIRIGWVIVRIGILAALIVLFNFFPGRIGMLASAANPDRFVPLAPEFRANMPWLNFWWGLALALEVAHLCLRRWRPSTRWADLALDVLAGLILLQVVLQGAILVRADSAAAVWSRLGTVRWEQSGVAILDLLIRGGLVLAIVAIAVDSRRKLSRCINGHQKPLPAASSFSPPRARLRRDAESAEKSK